MLNITTNILPEFPEDVCDPVGLHSCWQGADSQPARSAGGRRVLAPLPASAAADRVWCLQCAEPKVEFGSPTSRVQEVEGSFPPLHRVGVWGLRV